MTPVFASERLLFRKFTLADAELLYKLNKDPEVVKYVHEPRTTLENAPQVLTDIILPQYALYNHGRWAVHLKDTNEFIGWCGLKYIQEKDEVDLGYRFMQKYWGNGYATEAAKATINYGFKILNLPSIIAKAHVENKASLQVIEKCGMEFLHEEEEDGYPIRKYRLLNKVQNVQVSDTTNDAMKN
jgi:RimJ/RimL family protein N-acetyltransferase